MKISKSQYFQTKLNLMKIAGIFDKFYDEFYLIESNKDPEIIKENAISLVKADLSAITKKDQTLINLAETLLQQMYGEIANKVNKVKDVFANKTDKTVVDGIFNILSNSTILGTCQAKFKLSFKNRETAATTDNLFNEAFKLFCVAAIKPILANRQVAQK